MTPVDDTARGVMQDLLAGKSPNGTDPSACGPWCQIVEEMRKAHASGDTGAVRKAFDAAAKADPNLARLLAADSKPQTTWTVAELYKANLPNPRWIVPGIIPVGLTFLAGRPKVGKSWLSLQIAAAVASGGMVLNQQVEPGKVLFIALEDSPWRLRERLKKSGVPESADITFRTEWPLLTNGTGLAELQTAMATGGYRLIVLDTFSRALGKADQNDVSGMTLILSGLQQAALAHDCGLFVNDHHRKLSGFASSPVDDLLGSTAKAAVADAALGLYKQQGKAGATLKITGRDLEERELALQWDLAACCWQLLGEAGEVRKESVKGEILAAIRELVQAGEIASATSIARHIKRDRANVVHELNDLCNAGKVIKLTRQGKVQPYGIP